MPADELADYQKEYRRRVDEGLAELRASHREILLRLDTMRDEFARVKVVEDVDNRLKALESDKAKVIGAVVVLQVIGGVVVWLIGKVSFSKG